MAEFSLSLIGASSLRLEEGALTVPLKEGSSALAGAIEWDKVGFELKVSPSFSEWKESSVEIGVGIPWVVDLGAYAGTTLSGKTKFFGPAVGYTFLENDKTSFGAEASLDFSYVTPQEKDPFAQIFGNDMAKPITGGRFGLTEYEEGWNKGATLLVIGEKSLPINISLAGSLGVSVSPSSEPESFAKLEISKSLR